MIDFKQPNGKGSGGRLGPLQLVMASLRTLSLCRDDALRLGAVPALLHIAAMIYGQPALLQVADAVQQGKPELAEGAAGALFLTFIVALASTTLLTVNWLRFLLLGAQSAPGLGLNVSQAHFRFLGALVALGLAALFCLGLISIPIGLILGSAASLGAALAALAIGFVVVRLSLALVALAIGQPVGLGRAWEASQGQGIALLVAIILAQFPFYLAVIVIDEVARATGLGSLVPYTLLLISSLIQIAATMAQCGVLAAAYRRLIGVRA